MSPRPACFSTLGLAAALASCGPVEEKSAPPPVLIYIAPQVEVQRRNPNPSPEIHHWLEASASVRTQLASLRKELAGIQQLHVENHFDDFLSMDPATLQAGQLCYLQHFLERGFFRIEREVLLQLLEARHARAKAAQTPATHDIAGRLQSALERDETLLIDLESAIARYRSPGEEPFQIPTLLTETQVGEIRAAVTNGSMPSVSKSGNWILKSMPCAGLGILRFCSTEQLMPQDAQAVDRCRFGA